MLSINKILLLVVVVVVYLCNPSQSLTFNLPTIPKTTTTSATTAAPVAPAVVKLLDQNYYDRTFNSHVSQGSTFTNYIMRTYPEIFNTLPMEDGVAPVQAPLNPFSNSDQKVKT